VWIRRTTPSKVIEPLPAHKTAPEADTAAGIVFNRLGNLRRFAFVKMVNRFPWAEVAIILSRVSYS
jgi:hypothetical protein